jgi:hypothetical protein
MSDDTFSSGHPDSDLEWAQLSSLTYTVLSSSELRRTQIARVEIRVIECRNSLLWLDPARPEPRLKLTKIKRPAR